MRRRELLFALGFAGALLCGCGGDDDGVSGSKSVGDLSASELEGMCDDVDASYARFERAFVSVSCTEAARKSPSTCAATREQCIADTPSEGVLEGEIKFACSGTSQSIAETCGNATVAEIEACVEGIIDLVEGLAEQYTCTSGTSGIKAPETPKACVDLGERCALLAGFRLG